MRVNARFGTVGAALAAAFILATPAAAQTPEADLRRELALLRAQLEQLRAEVDALKAAVPPEPTRPPDPAVELLQTQVAELAQTKVGSESRFPVRLFGTIHIGAFGNSGNPNWLDLPNLATPPPARTPGGSFTASLRQTRLGVAIDGPSIGGARTSGVVAWDFFGGIPGFQTGQVMALPRLLVAFARVEGSRASLEVGQDHVILAPRDPSSLAGFAFPLLFRSGNLYLRAPQARVEFTPAPLFRASAGIVAPIGGDLTGEDYRFVPPALGGEHSRRPAVQARLELGSGDADAVRRAAAGVSGHYGWERREGALAESWAAALDFAARAGWIGAAGEAFTGANLDAFGGALGLDARAAGGWAELQLFPSNTLALTAGAGLDDLRDRRRALLPRSRNRSAYANVIVSVTPELRSSLEYRWLETRAAGPRTHGNHHFDWVLAYAF
jgi:hypothetical protein